MHVQVDPGKIEAIVKLPAPKNRKDLNRLLGIVSYLGKFSATLADDTVCLRTVRMSGIGATSMRGSLEI